MLYSVWTEFDLMPYVTPAYRTDVVLISLRRETSKRWSPKDGVWLVWWMKYQVFVPILLLQCLNLFWYYLILRIAVRYVSQLMTYPICDFECHDC